MFLVYPYKVNTNLAKLKARAQKNLYKPLYPIFFTTFARYIYATKYNE